jgi:hypothetical protein
MITNEQEGTITKERRLSAMLWDMLTGGAPYLEVLLCTLHPVFLSRLLWNLLGTLFHPKDGFAGKEMDNFSVLQKMSNQNILEESTMNLLGALGKTYQHGDVVIRQGEKGSSMYVVQDGYVEVIKEANGQDVQLAILGKDEFFGEMAIFEKDVRGATVRALGTARILTVDSKNMLRRIHEDPSLACRLVQVMSSRVRKLGNDYASFSNAVS